MKSNLKKKILMTLFTKQKQTYRYQKQNYDYQRGNVVGGGINQKFGINTYIIYKINNQQGPTAQQRELYSIFCNNLYEKTLINNRYMLCMYK